MLYIQGKIQNVEALTAKFNALPRVIEKATASALNKLGSLGVTETKRGITEIYNIKSGDVGKAITRVPAKASYGGKANRLYTVLYVKGSRMKLYKFGVLPTSPPSQKGVPVARRRTPTVKILKAGSRRPVFAEKSTGHGIFLARMTHGFGGSETDHVGLFFRMNKWAAGNIWRKGKAGTRHQVIREMGAKGIAERFISHGRDALDKMLAERGSDQLASELKYYFEKEMKK